MIYLKYDFDDDLNDKEFMDIANGWRYYNNINGYSGHVLSYFGKDRPSSIYEVNVYL